MNIFWTNQNYLKCYSNTFIDHTIVQNYFKSLGSYNVKSVMHLLKNLFNSYEILNLHVPILKSSWVTNINQVTMYNSLYALFIGLYL